MTESEVIEAINLHAANAMNGFTIYISFTFAYLVAAYSVGAKLSIRQSSIISLLYVLAASSFALTTITHTQSFGVIVKAYPDFAHSVFWHTPWTGWASTIQIGGIISSLYFMYDIRKKSKLAQARDEIT